VHVSQQRKLLFGNSDNDFLLADARQPDHRLAGIDHLPDLGVDTDDNGIVRSTQGRMCRLVIAGA
jgi:hypothetical protein